MIRKNLFSVIGMILCVCSAIVVWAGIMTPSPITYGFLWIVMGSIFFLKILGRI
jgi:hypothetical protein